MPVTDACDICGRERAQHMEIVGVGRVCPISGTTFRPKFDREAAERAGAQAMQDRIVAWLRDTRWLENAAAHAKTFAHDIERGEHVSDQERA